MRPITVARLAACALAWSCCGAAVAPSNVRISAISDHSLTFSSGDKVISTATLCPAYNFDQFGAGGPTFSPDFHFVLVDVLGPFTPGNVPRNRALITVATGGIVLAPDFPSYAGVPLTLDKLSWASGQRATLRYSNGHTATVHEPPPHPFPLAHCR